MDANLQYNNQTAYYRMDGTVVVENDVPTSATINLKLASD